MPHIHTQQLITSLGATLLNSRRASCKAKKESGLKKLETRKQCKYSMKIAHNSYTALWREQDLKDLWILRARAREIWLDSFS